MEEALRQQAINRLQRRQSQLAADEDSTDAEQAGTSSSAPLENIPAAAAAVPAAEMELVFKPHPKQLAVDNAIASETRYIKTTANATGMNISFYRAMLCIRGTSHGPVSVCPSTTSRCSTKMAKRRITQTTPHDSPGTLVF